MKKKLVEYLKGKYEALSIEIERVDKKYSKQYGHEYYVYFEKDGVHCKEIMSQFIYTMIEHHGIDNGLEMA